MGTIITNKNMKTLIRNDKYDGKRVHHERYDMLLPEGISSISEIVGAYKKPFEKDKIAEMVAKRSGREMDNVLSEWELKGDIGKDFGNTVHRVAELWIKYGQYPKNPILHKYTDAIKKIFPDRTKCLSEIKFINEDTGAIGTTDILLRVEKNVYDLYDIKTYSDIDKSKGKFTKEFKNLSDTDRNSTILQLLFYKRHIESFGEDKIRHIYMLRVTDRGFERIKLFPPRALINIINKIKWQQN